MRAIRQRLQTLEKAMPPPLEYSEEGFRAMMIDALVRDRKADGAELAKLSTTELFPLWMSNYPLLMAILAKTCIQDGTNPDATPEKLEATYAFARVWLSALDIRRQNEGKADIGDYPEKMQELVKRLSETFNPIEGKLNN